MGPRLRGDDSRCAGSGRLGAVLERTHELAVDRFVAGHDAAGDERRLTAREVGRIAAGLAHQRDARRHVPRRQVALPIAIEASGRDPGEIERGGSETAQTGNAILHGRGGFEQEGWLDRSWSVIVDLVCLAIVLWIASGVYMWWGLPGSRTWGLITIAAGAATFMFFTLRL